MDPAKENLAKLFNRHDWNAIPPRKVQELKTPVNSVVSTWAEVDPCFTVDECKKRVKELQRFHIQEKHMPDIQHHFMVGEDGNIYEGRGWYNLGPTYPSEQKFADELTGKSIEIAFLGRHNVKPSKTLVKAASDCVAFGLVGRFLQEKLLFFWRSPTKIEFLSSYETNAPGTSNPANFTEVDDTNYVQKDKLVGNKEINDINVKAEETDKKGENMETENIKETYESNNNTMSNKERDYTSEKNESIDRTLSNKDTTDINITT